MKTKEKQDIRCVKKYRLFIIYYKNDEIPSHEFIVYFTKSKK